VNILQACRACVPVCSCTCAYRPGRRFAACHCNLPGRRSLRSSSTSPLAVLSTHLCTTDDPAFPVTAARMWNSLPPEVTSSRTLLTFKSKLKTCHVFSVISPICDCKVTVVFCIIHLKFMYVFIYVFIYVQTFTVILGACH